MRFVKNNIKDLKQKIKLEGGKGVLQKTIFVVDTNTLIIIDRVLLRVI